MPIRILDLTRADMDRLMAKLAVNFGGKKDLDAKADLWYEKLEHYPVGIVERVIDRLLAEDHKYFPLIGRALQLAKEMAPDLGGESGESPQAKMRAWEKDPWATIDNLDQDRQGCTSAPCPVCQSVVEFTNRGALIVHDDARHKEAKTGYSNLGRPAWVGLPYMTTPEPKKKLQVSRTPNPYPPKEAPAPQLGELLPPAEASV